MDRGRRTADGGELITSKPRTEGAKKLLDVCIIIRPLFAPFSPSITKDSSYEWTRMRDHRDLEVWQKAMDLAAEIYFATENFPKNERFGLISQMRRAAVSIPSNIAEGAGRRTTKDFIAFAHTARGSLAELETQTLLAARVGLPLASEKWMPRFAELGRLLNGLIRGLHLKVRSGTHLR